jgi:asparagine synthase (glutamine-hydrolysing)
MCGIVGVLDPKKQINYIADDISYLLEHRGPDEGGSFNNKKIGLSFAMKRLAILDIKNGQQPYISPEGYVVIFNGEIFNSEDLYNSLGLKQKSFLKFHECEVIALLYKKYGKQFLEKLNGMFSVAIFDQKNNTFLIARDRYGIKPLYYLSKGDLFCFSSEIKPLIKCLNKKINLDKISISNYFRLGYVPNPTTIYKEIKQLPPGSYIEYNLTSKKFKTHKWWVIPHKTHANLSEIEWHTKLENQISDSLKRWSVSEVPVAFSLSGGLDSSALVALASINSKKRIKTFSLGFEGQNEESWSELEIAKEVALQYNTDHTEIILNPDKLADNLSDMIWHLEQPYAGGLPSWELFRQISNDYKVAIIGSGGDEIFGNYNRGRYFSQTQNIQSIESFNVDIFEKSIQDEFLIMKKNEAKKILKINNSEAINHLVKLFNSSSFMNIDDRVAQLSFDSQLVDEFLMMTDRFSMAHSLEVRTPYLDHDLVNMIFSMPIKYRLDRNIYKKVLRKSIGHLLPQSVLTAKKNGFSIPLSLWMRGRLREVVEEFIGEAALKNNEYIKLSFYQDYVKPMLKGNNEHIALIWSILMFQIWLRNSKNFEKSNPIVL